MNAPVSLHHDALTISLHWLIAAAILATFLLGLQMVGMPFSPDKLQRYAWHKWAGLSIWCLVWLRVIWRLWRGGVAASLSGWQASMARWTHRALYVLMLCIPLSGWLMSSAKGVSVVLFGLWHLPDMVGRDEALGEVLRRLHVSLNYALAGLVLLHAAAALKHHFIDRNDVLARMLPGARANALGAVLMLALLLPADAIAAEYTRLVPERSRIAFVYRQMNVPMEGEFTRFASVLRFDPAHPEQASVRFDIELASVDTGLAEGDAEIRGRDWFDTAGHPVARFVLQRIRALGANSFEALGSLTIKGRTLPVSVPLKIAERPDGLLDVSGSFTILRARYGIGEGAWSDFATVANEVQVRLQLQASQAIR